MLYCSITMLNYLYKRKNMMNKQIIQESYAIEKRRIMFLRQQVGKILIYHYGMVIGRICLPSSSFP